MAVHKVGGKGELKESWIVSETGDIMKKKLLFVCNNLIYGGIPRSLISLLKEIKDDYDIDLLLFWQGGEYIESVPEGVNLIPAKGLLPLLGMPQAKVNRESAAQGIFRAGLVGWSRLFSNRGPRKMTFATAPKLEGYDVAISYAQDNSGRNYAIGCNDFVLDRVEAARKVAFVHCDFLRYGGNDRLTRAQYRRFDRIACVSRSARKALLNALPELRDKTFVVENCTDFEEIRRLAEEPVEDADSAEEAVEDAELAEEPVEDAELAEEAVEDVDSAEEAVAVFSTEYGDSAADLHINMVSVSRLTKEKGYVRAIEVLKDLMKEYSGLTWTVVGDGPCMKEIVYAARDAGILERIHLVGAQANPYPYMARADFLFLPSLHEAAPMVVGEAKALGLPLLATDTCTMVRKAAEDGCGLVCENSAEGIREGLEKICGDPAILDEFRAKIAVCPTDNSRQKEQFAAMLDGVQYTAVETYEHPSERVINADEVHEAADVKLSVIVAVYNRANVIRRCIDSLLHQDIEECEYIFVDDCSDDGTAEILREYAAADSRVKVITQDLPRELSGVARARNTGLEAASGRYVTWVDSDDWVERNIFGKLYEKAEEWDADVLLFDGWEVSPSGSRCYGAFEEPFAADEGRISRAEYLLARPCPWNKWIRRRILRKMHGCPDFHFPEGEIYEDLSTLPTLALRTDRIFYLRTQVYHYWQSDSSIMHQSKWRENMRSIFRAVRRLQKVMAKDFPDEVEYIWWLHLLLNGSQRFLDCGRQDMAEKAARWMKKYYPDWRKNSYVRRSSRGARVSAGLLAAANYAAYRRYRALADRAKSRKASRKGFHHE